VWCRYRYESSTVGTFQKVTAELKQLLVLDVPGTKLFWSTEHFNTVDENCKNVPVIFSRYAPDTVFAGYPAGRLSPDIRLWPDTGYPAGYRYLA
jgi:hypothetical protein